MNTHTKAAVANEVHARKQADAERDAAIAKVDELKAERDEAIAKVDELKAERDEAIAERAALRDVFNAQSATVAGLQKAAAERDDLRQQLKAVEQALRAGA